MTIKTMFCALVLTILPGFAMAMCSGHEDTATMSCADGLTFDTALGKCVDSANS